VGSSTVSYTVPIQWHCSTRCTKRRTARCTRSGNFSPAAPGPPHPSSFISPRPFPHCLASIVLQRISGMCIAASLSAGVVMLEEFRQVMRSVCLTSRSMQLRGEHTGGLTIRLTETKTRNRNKNQKSKQQTVRAAAGMAKARHQPTTRRHAFRTAVGARSMARKQQTTHHSAHCNDCVQSACKAARRSTWQAIKAKAKHRAERGREWMDGCDQTVAMVPW